MFTGQWKSSNTVAIVDFCPHDAKLYPDVLTEFLDRRIYWTNASYNKGTWTEEEHKKMGRKWLKEWQLLEKIDVAAAQIVNVRAQMKKIGVDVRPSGFSDVDNLDEFISNIKENLKQLGSLLC